MPILEDLSKAKLLWTTEIDDLGYGKTSSGGVRFPGEGEEMTASPGSWACVSLARS